MDNTKIGNFVISVATVNGSGSQTANTVLLKSLFRGGTPVGAKNVFPSNISGMPTWFWIRANEKGFVGAQALADIVVALNPQTVDEDQKLLKPGGFFLYPQEKMGLGNFRSDIVALPIPFRKLVESISATPKIKKLAGNMIYVGILARLLGVESNCVQQVIRDQLGNKTSALELNLQAFEIGQQFAQGELSAINWPFQARTNSLGEDKILMDGNTAAALGLIAGGCQVVSWYPITPSTSLVEAFSGFAEKLRKDHEGRNKFAIVQAEDELAAFSMVLGAGWAGTRAMTATSGPGLSLMAEGAGYAYHAEIPAVIWDVQRLGPSTGLPTKTAQGDLIFAAHLSHGDAKHILLFPGSIEECFEFGQTCFDLAERLQQLVIVLMDLDLGMNLWMGDALRPLGKCYDRGKILNADQLDEKNSFTRYEEQDQDGIAARTLPGNKHPNAAYFTRGSGHNSKAQYSERASDYRDNSRRLQRKWETAKKLMPAPEIRNLGSYEGLIYFGSTRAVIDELLSLLPAPMNLCRLKAYPFSLAVEQFLQDNEKVYIVEQNREGQMMSLLLEAFPHMAAKMISLVHFDGTPITADLIRDQISKQGSFHGD